MVGKICTVCRNSSYVNKHLSFFTYPGDPERRYRWLKAVDRLDLLEKLEDNRTRGNHRICEAHFEDKYVRRSTVCEGRKSLAKNAFPTRCLVNNVSRVTKVRVKRTKNLSEDDENLSRRDFDTFSDGNMSSSSCPDISEFLESVIKVSKGTQTPHVSEDCSSVLDEDSHEETLQEVKIESMHSRKSFLQLCCNYLPNDLTQLIKFQLSCNNMAHNLNLNLFALSLYYTGINSYDFLKNILGLPTLQTLRTFLVPKTTKLNNVLLKALKAKVINMSQKEKICSVSIGSISLKPNLHYDIKHDRIIGFHDVDGMQNIDPARYAIVLMVQGIIRNWQQVLAYSFISEYNNFSEVSIWIDSVIIKLIDMGFDVRAFISDPRSEFLYASETRQVLPNKTYFTLNNRNIYYLYDTSQLLKVVKNNLKSCDFHCNGTDFLKKLYNLFSLLNSRTLRSNDPFQQPFTYSQFQSDFMEDMLALFQKLKVVRKVDGIDVTQNMMFIDGFQITIKSIIQLYCDLKAAQVKYLLTSKLNQEKLNDFFIGVKKVTGEQEQECTARRFNKYFVKTFVSNMMKKPVGNTRNKSHISSEIESYSFKLLNEPHIDENANYNKPLRVYTTDYRKGLPDKNAFVYVCGYIYLKCLERHDCIVLRAFLRQFQDNKDTDEPTYLCNVHLENEEICKILPPDSFTDFLMILENKFKEYFKSNVFISSIGQELWKEFQNYEFDMPCPCFPIDYLKSLFIRIRIFYTIRKNNRIFRKKHGTKTFRVYSL